MSDQAAALRRALAAAPPPPPAGPARPEVTVIGSGKGGTGKSTLAVATGAALARRGARVLLCDASQNQGNLHVLLGVRPAAPLEALLAGEVEPEALLVPLAPGLTLLPADSGHEAIYGLTAVDRARLHYRLSGLFDGFDAVLVDAPPGLEAVVRAATIRATRLAVVTVPEPASLSDAYALVKIVHLQVPSLPVDVVVNRAEGEEEARAVHARLDLAARRFLRRTLGDLGHVAESAALRRAVRRPGALLAAEDPGIERLADRLCPAPPTLAAGAA
jgi:flagellar biosynthesis protein FlhG